MTVSAMSDFGDTEFLAALVNVTNVCNLDCAHCFVFRDSNPNSPKDKMDDATMLRELEILRDKHGIRTMLFMGGEPMIRKDLVFKAMALFDECSIVTNGTYGIPSAPGHVVTVSLDGPEALNDLIRGEGVFQKVKKAVFERKPNDGTSVILQMTITRQNEAGIEDFVEEVKDWPISGVAFTFYVPQIDDDSGMAWGDLRERDPIVDRAIAIKKKYHQIVKANVGALELMKSEIARTSTGKKGENCPMHNVLPLYMGEGGQFERTFCCYGNEVDCARCGAYSVFNRHYQRQQGLREGRRWSSKSRDN
jgi:MoaA/NifB/PqqE/SkfB family radical SAM enzyme